VAGKGKNGRQKNSGASTGGGQFSPSLITRAGDRKKIDSRNTDKARFPERNPLIKEYRKKEGGLERENLTNNPSTGSTD